MSDARLPEKVRSRIKVIETGCWIWQGSRTTAGYGNCYLRQIPFRRAIQHYVHRFVFEALRGPIPEGLQIDHLCRVRACCNPNHLEPVTHAENGRRGLATGNTWARGERCGTSKLTEAQVREIRGLWAAGVKQTEIARRFGLTSGWVSRIVNRKWWIHLR